MKLPSIDPAFVALLIVEGCLVLFLFFLAYLYFNDLGM